MNTILARAFALLILVSTALRAQVPQIINYQGRVAVGTLTAVNFDGSGQFRFALVNAAGTTTYWSNDGTSTAGSQPTAAVALTVTKGLYSVLLGDTAPPLSMTAIPASVWANPDVRLRVWFNDGTNGSQLLTPDQRLAPNGYIADGSVSSAAIASGAITSTKIAAGAVTNTQLAAGAVANGNLANSALTVTAGSGLGGGGAVSLGGNVTLTNAGVLSLTGGGGITVNAGTGAITLGSNATSANTAGTLVLRDASGDFSARTLTLGGNLALPATTATTGAILVGGGTLLHSFGSNNVFVGLGAGNRTMAGGRNTASGVNALTANTTGSSNTASGVNALLSNTTGSDNTASGDSALASNTTGGRNTASGVNALTANTTGNYNTASGVNALLSNTTGSSNTASGESALASNTTGNYNTAIGEGALVFNTTGLNNTALGRAALKTNTTGPYNTAIGVGALEFNTTGLGNAALGHWALKANTTGQGNTGIGDLALDSNTTGFWNTAVGNEALTSNTTGIWNTAVGNLADVTSGNLTNATAIGANAKVNASNKVRIGDIQVSVIEGQVGFTASSDRTKKENFQPVDGAEVLRKIREFKLTSWNFIGHDPKEFRHYGPMAQDFFAAFGHDAVGAIGTETTINNADLSGILLSAVQALDAENLVMRDENAAMKKRLAELEAKDKEREARLARLEQFIPETPKAGAAGAPAVPVKVALKK